MITHTRTYAVLEVPGAFYDLVREKLLAAGYDQAVHHDRGHGEVVDMHGIALARGEEQTDNAAKAVRRLREFLWPFVGGADQTPLQVVDQARTLIVELRAERAALARLHPGTGNTPVEHRPPWVPTDDPQERAAQERYDREHPCQCPRCRCTAPFVLDPDIAPLLFEAFDRGVVPPMFPRLRWALYGKTLQPGHLRTARLRLFWWHVVRRYESELCQRCGGPVRLVFHVPDALWEQITGGSRSPGGEAAPGVLCPPCVDELATQRLGRGGFLRWTCAADDTVMRG